MPRLPKRMSMNATMRKITKGATLSISEALLSARNSGFACHSAESVVSTVTMSSTPRVTPPLKSPVLKRGAMALTMMTLDKASVSVPSSP